MIRAKSRDEATIQGRRERAGTITPRVGRGSAGSAGGTKSNSKHVRIINVGRYIPLVVS